MDCHQRLGLGAQSQENRVGRVRTEDGEIEPNSLGESCRSQWMQLKSVRDEFSQDGVGVGVRC